MSERYIMLGDKKIVVAQFTDTQIIGDHVEQMPWEPRRIGRYLRRRDSMGQHVRDRLNDLLWRCGFKRLAGRIARPLGPDQSVYLSNVDLQGRPLAIHHVNGVVVDNVRQVGLDTSILHSNLTFKTPLWFAPPSKVRLGSDGGAFDV